MGWDNIYVVMGKGITIFRRGLDGGYAALLFWFYLARQK